MSTAVLNPPQSDLGQVIELERERLGNLRQVLEQLPVLEQMHREISDKIRMCLGPMPAGVVAQQIRSIEARAANGTKKAKGGGQTLPRIKNEKPLGDIIYEYLSKHPDVKGLRVADAARIGAEGGYKSRSNNLYGVTLSMFMQDERFKKHKVPGEKRAVVWGLKDH